jgi:hypothetical protein
MGNPETKATLDYEKARSHCHAPITESVDLGDD